MMEEMPSLSAEKVPEMIERQQTPEEIPEILDGALREQIPLDATILDLDGTPYATGDLNVARECKRGLHSRAPVLWQSSNGVGITWG